MRYVTIKTSQIPTDEFAGFVDTPRKILPDQTLGNTILEDTVTLQMRQYRIVVGNRARRIVELRVCLNDCDACA